jgi:hypothetical protein
VDNNPPAQALWHARSEAFAYLELERPRQLVVFQKLFALIDRCIDSYEVRETTNLYATVCAVTLLKAKNLGVAAYSLVLDGLGQEAGALIRPFIEYTELLTYFRRFPDQVTAATTGELPNAGKRAKAINGDYKGFRDHLNAHASHSSYSTFALAHLRDPATSSLKKLQPMVPQVLERNLRDLAIQIWLLLCEGAASLDKLECHELSGIASDSDALKEELMNTFGLFRDNRDTALAR